MKMVTIEYLVEQEADGGWHPLSWPYAYLFYDADCVPSGTGVGVADDEAEGPAFEGLPPTRA